MEYVEAQKPLCTFVALAYKLAQTIHYLHSNNVCHTDIKPKNIIITGMGVKLIDFGESMKIQMWKRGRTGTYGYMAPEMFE
jgi:serine/threonine protein kinase